MAELEQLQLRLGSAGIEPVSAAPGLAPGLGTSGEMLSDSLAGILGQELEREENQPDGGATGPPTVATTRPPSRESSPTFISGGNARGQRGELRQPPARQNLGWRVLPAAVALGGVVAAVTWLLLPSRVVVHRTVPTPALIAAAAVGSLPERSPVPSSPQVKPTVSWSVDTLPSGARVVRADTHEVLGITPWRSEPAKRIGSLVVRLGHPGFADKEVRLDYSQSRNQTERKSQLPGTQARPPGHRGTGEKKNPPADPPSLESSYAYPKPPFEFIE